QNVKASLSIGGCTGSQYFSSLVFMPESRTVFVNAILDLIQRYDLDGIDFEYASSMILVHPWLNNWEYPVIKGLPCNQHNTTDSVNFLSFLKELRSRTNKTLTAAVTITQFPGEDSQLMTDVSESATVLDRIG
ncbi:glycoside hydrolase superfamily, partial [Mycena leptocephala]